MVTSRQVFQSNERDQAILTVVVAFIDKTGLPAYLEDEPQQPPPLRAPQLPGRERNPV
jgi:hypothetical protein